MPEILKKEVLDFIGYLLNKYSAEKVAKKLPGSVVAKENIPYQTTLMLPYTILKNICNKISIASLWEISNE